MPDSSMTAVILAGGRGQRMGGKNKGLIRLAGKPLVEHVLQRLQPQIENIVISANEQTDDYACYNLPVIRDKPVHAEGPLAGIYSVMCEITTEWLITVPCDTPNIPQDYVARMRTCVDSHLACVAHDGYRQQSGFCLLHKSLKDDLYNSIQDKQLAVHRFLTRHNAVSVDFSECETCFVNINTPEQLAAMEKHAHGM